MSNTNNNNNGQKKAFNPTVTAMFQNAKFGDGSFLSAAIDAKGFEAIQRFMQIGSKLVLRKSKVKASTGNDTYFLEILPPLEAGSSQSNGRRANTQTDDGI